MKCILPYEVSLTYFEGFFNMRNILRHGADGLTPPLKGGMQWILIAFKN
jgi:hypothetical protein